MNGTDGHDAAHDAVGGVGGELRQHLLRSRLAGDVATSPGSTLDNCGKLLAGDPRYTFGLSDWRDATFLEVVQAVRTACGGDPGGGPRHGAGRIDVDRTLAGIAAHRDALAELCRSGGGRVLLATGHPTGLLPHYAAIARRLQSRGSLLLAPLDDEVLSRGEDGRDLAMRFLDGVGCLTDGGKLLHTHRSRYMEALLDATGSPVDLVIADHGMAGAAIERGLPTLAIADVNDPALLLAQQRRRTRDVLVIDDNLAPRLFVPVTRAVLAFRRPLAAMSVS